LDRDELIEMNELLNTLFSEDFTVKPGSGTIHDGAKISISKGVEQLRFGPVGQLKDAGQEVGRMIEIINQHLLAKDHIY